MTADVTNSETKEYWHGLAALRAAAMLLGIVLHSAIPFMAHPLTGMNNWIYFQTPTLICDMATWWIHVWRIPLFFFLAGFFALQTLQRHGGAGFAKKRFKRLVVPYFAAVYTVGPMIYVVFHLGWYVTGQCSWDQVWPHIPLPPRLAENFFGPLHLWFLQDLIILSAVFLFLYAVLAPQGDWSTPPEKRLPWWTPFGPGLVTGLLLWSDPSPLLEFHNTFLCVPARLLYYTVFFIGGVTAYRHRSSFFRVTNSYRSHLLVAAVLSFVFLWLRLGPAIDVLAPVSGLVFSLVAGSLCWLLIYGLIGACNVWFREPHPGVTWLSDASYAVYIIHLPVVGLMQLAVYDAPWHSAVKSGVVILATTGICLLSYQFLVRYTVIGSYLHGPRRRPGTEGHSEDVLQRVPTA